MSDERVIWCEIDLDVCSRRWGVAPCDATLSARNPNKCVIGFKTCRSADNYLATTETLVLTMQKQVGLPIAGRHFPVLTAVKESEQTVNIAGSDPKLAALGRRAFVTIDGVDLMYEDRFLDPYYDERISGAAQFSGVGYQPVGLFFARLRARDPYFAGYPIRVKQGRVVGGALITDRTHHYIMTEFDPAKGKFRIEGVDVLDLASNQRALIPAPSQGRLLEAIADNVTTFTLVPEGIGSDYDTSGFVTIGREIMEFTRSGDVMTVTRGRFNTAASGHAASAGVQECWRYVGKAHGAVNAALTYKGTVPSSWIPFAEWAAEAVVWFDVDVDTIISKPMPIAEAVGELSILGFSLFTDLAAQKIRFRPNRFLFADELDAAPVISDADIIGDLKYEGNDEQRLTRVELRSVQLDPTSGLDDNNFVEHQMVISGDSEDPRAYGDVRYRLEKTRWLNQGAGPLVRILANRYLRRFKTPPELVEVTVKRRKYGSVNLADVVKLETRHLPSEYAQPTSGRLFQVTQRRDLNAGEIVLSLKRFEYAGNFGFWAPDDAPDYDDATDAQKDRMAFWGPDTGDTFDDGRPLYEWG